MTETDVTIKQDMIDYGDRQYYQQIPAIINTLHIQIFQNLIAIIQLSDRLTREALKRVERENSLSPSLAREAASSRHLVRALDRITNLEISFYTGQTAYAGGLNQADFSPAGYQVYGGAIVAPVSIVGDGNETPLGASLVLKLDEV